MSGTVIVFGGSGFIATHFIRRLRLSERCPIISADILPPREQVEGVEYRTLDVRDLTNFQPPYGTKRIYNFAAIHRTPGHPDWEYYETNVGGAVEITQLAARHDIPEIIFTSSISVYGPGEDTKIETTPLAPESAYGRSKLLAESIHKAWLQGDPSRRLVIVRPAVVFGSGEGGNFTRMAALLRKGFFVFPGREDTIKACIYVEDLADAIEFARTQASPFVLFNGCYPQRYTVKQIVNIFRESYFPRAYTFKVPLRLVLLAAGALRVADAFKLGIHPERVLKLVHSTDVFPAWLNDHGMQYPDALKTALRRWDAASHGRFA